MQINVENSPFAHGYSDAGLPVCAPIAGMLSAVASLASGQVVVVVETDCRAAGAKKCSFASPAATR